MAQKLVVPLIVLKFLLKSEMPGGNCNIFNNIDISLSFHTVKHELETLNCSCFKSYGPDNIHLKLLQSLADDCSFDHSR